MKLLFYYFISYNNFLFNKPSMKYTVVQKYEILLQSHNLPYGRDYTTTDMKQ